jgi:hypothetical protein
VYALVCVAEECLQGAAIRSVVCTKNALMTQKGGWRMLGLTLAGLCDNDDVRSAFWEGFLALALDLRNKKSV